MLKYLLVCLSVFAIVGCNKSTPNPVAPVVCSIEQGAADALSKAVQTQCSCKTPGAMSPYFLSKLGSLNLCTASGKVGSVIGDVICKPLLTSVFAKGCSSLPADWGCTGAVDSGQALNAAIAFCQSSI